VQKRKRQNERKSYAIRYRLKKGKDIISFKKLSEETEEICKAHILREGEKGGEKDYLLVGGTRGKRLSGD